MKEIIGVFVQLKGFKFQIETTISVFNLRPQFRTA
jgi:hypothetical protein